MKNAALEKEEERHERQLEKLGVRHVKRGRMVKRKKGRKGKRRG